MSKLRPSPRRGGRRSKQIPHDTLDISCEDNPPGSVKTQAKLKTSPSNKNSTAKKPGKSPRNKSSKKTIESSTTGTTSKGKEVKSKKQSNGKNKIENDIENDELGYQHSEESGLGLKSSSKKKTVQKNDNPLDDNDEDCDNVQSFNDSLDDSVGKELIECLSKGGRKKKAMRNCNNCGTQSPVSRAKKCPNCGKNLFSKSSGYSREVTCPKCDHHQRFNGTLTTVYCNQCNNLLTRKYKEKDSSVSPQNEEETDELLEQRTPLVDRVDTTTIEEQYTDDTHPTCPVNNDGSFQMGYTSSTATPQDNDIITNNVDIDHNDSLNLFGNETSQETLRRIIKRKILGEFDQIESGSPPNKKPCNEESDDESIAAIEKQPQHDTDERPLTNIKQSLPLSIPTSVVSNSNVVSSPLMEYAQKISARIFLPPEMPPQDNYVRRGGRSRKQHSAKNKRLQKESNLSRHQHSPSPMAGASPDHTSSSQDSMYNETTPLPPPLVRSDEDGVSHTSIDCKDYETGSHSQSHPVIPRLVTATKLYHDPTINSTAPPTLTNSNTFYSSSDHSMIPPLITPLSYTASEMSMEDENNKMSSHNAQFMSKNLYPEYRTSSVPPLLCVTQDGCHKEDDPTGDGHGVTHTTVIVDQRTALNAKKDSSAPPCLLSDTCTTQSSLPTKGDDGLIDNENQAEVVYDNNNSVSTSGPFYKATHSKRKQKVHLVDPSSVDEGGDEIIYEPAVLKKKKKKKKREKEKDKERTDKGHHSKSKGDKHRLDSEERKARKKLKREKKRELITEDLVGESQDDYDEGSSQCTNDSQERVITNNCIIHQITWGEYQMSLLVPQPRKQDIQEKETTPTLTTTDTPATPTDSDIQVTSDSVTRKGRRLRSSQKKRKYDEIPDECDSVIDQQQEESPLPPPPPAKETKKNNKKKQQSKSRMETESEPLLPPVNVSPIGGNDQLDNNMEDCIINEDPLLPSFSIYELRNKIFCKFPPRTVHAFVYKLSIRTRRPPLYWIHILKIIGGLPETCHMCRLLDVESLKLLCTLHKIDVPDCIDNLIGPHPNMNGRKLIDLSDKDPSSFLLNPEVLHLSLPRSTFHRQKSYRKSLASDASSQHDGIFSKKKYKKKQQQYIEEDGQLVNDGEDTMVAVYSADQSQKIKKKKNPKKSSKLKQLQQISPTISKCSGDTVSPDADHAYKHNGVPGTGKKKPCPNCGYSMLRKSKKCVNCGKPFGVFTFGRRQCTNCDHINLARMAVCFKCGQSLDKAPTAVPKITEIFDGPETAEPHDSVPLIKHDFKFGVKRKRRIPSVPSPPLTATTIIQQDIVTYDSGDDVFHDDSDQPRSPVAPNEKRKRGDSQHSGYRYGKIPWNDADLALIGTSNGVPKLCLQEVCNKVLRYHLKSDVFELVKSLNLQLEPGDGNLLKKLQALGLHPNRSPMCRLIASEDLFALMDALEEPVPDEVYHYMENVGSSNTLEVYSGALMSHVSSSPNTPSGSMATKPFMIGDDQKHGFESTLHEVECSDGQLLAMLRSWDGDHFLCLLEVWRRYFPEVNRSNLSAVIKRLDIETKIPTSQQTNLLRAAGIISVRGAPGRLIKVSDVQRVIDDFDIMLKIGDSITKEDEERTQFPTYRGLNTSKSVCLAKKPGPQSQTNELANCMTLLLDSVEPSAMESLLLTDQIKYTKQLEEIQTGIQGQSMQENILHNHILCRRQLCTVLNDEISFLTVTNHSIMKEIVHMSYTLRQMLNEIDSFIDTSQIVKKPLT